MRFEGSRVLVVGPNKVGDMAWFVSRSLRRVGAKVLEVDDRAYLNRGLPGRMGVALERLEQMRPGSRRMRTVRGRISRMAREADIVFCVMGTNLDANLVAEIARARPIVNWYPDHPVFDQVLEPVAAYTLFLAKDTWSTERLRAMGFSNVFTLQHASDPSILGGRSSFPERSDLVVLGTMYPHRRFWVERALAAGATVQVWGARKPSGELDLKAYHWRQAVGADQGRAFRSGTASLSTHHPEDVAGGNHRIFDAAAAGVAQITEDLPDTQMAFEPGAEILTFADIGQFNALVADTKARPSWWAEVGRKAQKRVLAEHTYEHRMREIERLLRQC